MIKGSLLESFGLIKKKDNVNNIINNNNNDNNNESDENKMERKGSPSKLAILFPVSLIATIPRLALDFYGIDMSKSSQPNDLKTSSFVGYDYEKYCINDNYLIPVKQNFARKKTSKIRNSINSGNNSKPKNGIF
jgi:hypothetical protein